MSEATEHSFSNPAEEAGAAKLWSVYVDEAERYDKSLVASWKSDMEGMLIFAGLFSASLTAFLIESYKTLVQDPGDATVELLQQILVVSSSNSTLTPLTPEPFKPTTSSLVCNALWFISLGLSLSCALVATLLEQWARDFLHRANMRSSPGQRARIYSYLYYGLRRFKMHAVVEIIPSLLHAALLFFFCGLVVFLVPVNKIIAALVAGILFLVVFFYVFLTILPLIHFDSPYRTPLSNAVWGTYQFCSRLWHQPPKLRTIHPIPITIIDNVIEQAIMPSDNRQKRDSSALLWTVDSLSDNNELQTFVEAIPDAMWGPYKQHHRNVAAMTALRDSEEVNLAFRISELWRSCDDGLLSDEAAERRGAACLRAFWALYTIPTQFNFSYPHILPLILLHFPWRTARFTASNSSIYVSIWAVAGWSGLAWLRQYLDQYLDPSIWAQAGVSRDFTPVLHYMRQFHLSSAEINRHAQSLQVLTNTQQQLVAASQKLYNSISYHILLDYVRTIAVAESPPYRWVDTLRIIWPEELQSTRNNLILQSTAAIPDITDDNLKLLEEVEAAMDFVCIWSSPGPLSRDAMVELCFLWRPRQARCIPAGLISYIKHHGIEPDTLVPHTGSAFWNSQICSLLKQTAVSRYIWRCFPATITSDEFLEDTLAAFWVVVDAITEFGRSITATSTDEFDAVVQALMVCPAPSATAVLLAVKSVRLWIQINDYTMSWSDRRRNLGVVVAVIADFLEECNIADIVEAQRAIAALRIVLNLDARVLNLVVDEAQQTRFARGLLRVAQSSEPAAGHMVVRKVLEGTVFDPSDGVDRFHWVMEAAAQADMRHVHSLLVEPGATED
ncbi:hypothetical protein MIND_01219500 [Mycena indigotica]|uniref:DUF6535 domain-containing protein n=1 Tax=Mycena indigotica TaxID=2126181 RepID=A0A8H6S608_9AGAR|nr:uncharacterized protein MIND_01219500 [Mycena indigotica]KAF7291940.1 hypothetical protein MIND_01219500 [Mycena indigotica]